MNEAINEIEQRMNELLLWGSTVKIEDIPESVIKRAIIGLGDHLAAITAAENEFEIHCLRKNIMESKLREESTVFLADGKKTDRYSACVLNAAGANWCELEEGYRKVTCHAGLYTLPALLAEAEAEGSSIEEVIKALIVAYEIVTRFARTWTFPSLVSHPHAIFSCIGACAAVAVLKKLNQKKFYNALSSSVTLVGIGPWNHAIKGALIENMWAASGAWNGLKAVEWSECGISGIRESFSNVMEGCLGAETNAEELKKDLGIEWAICNGYTKMYGCCQYAHSTVEACLGVLQQLDAELSVDDIEEIYVETHKLGIALNDKNPKTTLGAKFSIPHITASTLVFGDASAETFGKESLNNEDVKKLRRRVKLEEKLPEKSWPNDRGARVTLVLSNNKKYSFVCESARGGPDNPYSDSEILKKIESLSSNLFPGMSIMIEKLYNNFNDFSNVRWAKFVEEIVYGGRPE